MPDDDTKRDNCDRAVSAMARLLIEDMGTSPGLVLDRLLTFAAAHAVAWTGTFETTKAFRQMAERIERGMFAHLEGGRDATRH